MPSEILLSTGVPNQPIELSAKQLSKKAANRGHRFDVKDIANLPQAIQAPIAVFEYGNKDKSQNLIVEIERDGKKFVVGIHFNQNRRGIVVNDIRGLFNKDSHEWLNWISQGKRVSRNLVGINFRHPNVMPNFAVWKTITYRHWHRWCCQPRF